MRTSNPHLSPSPSPPCGNNKLIYYIYMKEFTKKFRRFDLPIRHSIAKNNQDFITKQKVNYASLFISAIFSITI